MNRQRRNRSSKSAVRVLYIANSSQIGGGNRSLLTLWRGLPADDVVPIAMCPDNGPMVEACHRENIPCTFSDYHQPSLREPLGTWRGYRRWTSLLAEWQPALIHANHIGAARSVAFAARRAHIPVVCHVRFPSTAAYVRWAFRGTPSPRTFIFNSHALHGQMNAMIAEACPRAAQVVIHNAVDLSSFRAVKRSDGDRLRVGMLANLLPVKGYEDFLAMAQLLVQQGLPVDFWAIGEDVHRTGYGEELRALAERLGLADRVTFLGHCDNVPELLQQLQVLVCCSHVEPFGRCLIEAMACGTPVVATNVGGIPEVVVDGITGFLVPPARPEEVALKVTQLLHNEPLRRQMGEAGRERAERHFSVQHHAQQTLALYDSLLSASRIP